MAQLHLQYNTTICGAYCQITEHNILIYNALFLYFQVQSLNGYHPSSFPGTASSYNFQNWWESLRQIFTSPNDIERLNGTRRGSSIDLDVFENEH